MCSVTEPLTSDSETNMNHKNNGHCSSIKGGSQPNSVLLQVLPYVFVGFCGMNVVFNTLVSLDLPKLLNLPPVAPEYCLNDDDKDCSRPDLMAFAVISESVLLLCAGLGLYAWHARRLRIATAPQSLTSAETRLFGHVPANVWIISINLTYQIWDIYVSARSIPDHCTVIMMTHHFVAAIVDATGLHAQIFHCYATVFVGLSEVSSIFLVICNLSRVFPPVPGTTIHLVLHAFCLPAFMLSFMYYRVYLWWYVSYCLFQDVRTVIRTGTAEKLRPGCTWFLYELVCFVFPMGILQLYWLGVILAIVKRMIL